MSGRGRGRGGWGRGRQWAPEKPVEIFPDFVGGKLPNVKDIPDEKTKAIWNAKLTNYTISSPYFIQDAPIKESEGIDIERFSDWGKQKTKSRSRNTLDQFLLLNSRNFPADLIDSNRVQQNPKRVRWNTETDLKKLDDLEKNFKGKDEGGEDKEEDDEDRESGGPSDEEISDDGDYNQNRDFDDDDDDYNDDDGGNDEPEY